MISQLDKLGLVTHYIHKSGHKLHSRRFDSSPFRVQILIMQQLSRLIGRRQIKVAPRGLMLPRSILCFTQDKGDNFFVGEKSHLMDLLAFEEVWFGDWENPQFYGQ